MAKVSSLGFGVAKPWGDSGPYDFIVESGGTLARVQVKSAHVAGRMDATAFVRMGMRRMHIAKKKLMCWWRMWCRRMCGMCFR